MGRMIAGIPCSFFPSYVPSLLPHSSSLPFSYSPVLPSLPPSSLPNTGCTPRDLAMDCDFYECADLIDDLKKLKMKHDDDLLRAERLIGKIHTVFRIHGLSLISVLRSVQGM